MKSKFLGLRTIIYKVTELKKATEWYSKAFNTEPYFNEPYYVGFEIGGYELGLHPWESNKLTMGDNLSPYWGVDNVQAEYDRLIGLGATAFEAPENVGGDIIVGAVKDPWGNVIGMIYNPNFKAK